MKYIKFATNRIKTRFIFLPNKQNKSIFYILLLLNSYKAMAKDDGRFNESISSLCLMIILLSSSKDKGRPEDSFPKTRDVNSSLEKIVS